MVEKSWLASERLRREVKFNLAQGIRNLSRKFSYARVKGCSFLLRYLVKISEQNSKEELDFFIKYQQMNEYFIVPKLMDALRACQSEIPHVAIVEIQLILELLQGLTLLCERSKLYFRDPSQFRLLLALLSIDDDEIRVSTLENIQCILAVPDQKLSMNLEEIYGLQKICDLLRKQHMSDEIVHGCIECLYVYLSPEKPVGVSESSTEFKEWVESFRKKRANLESVVGDAFVKQLLTTAGIGTISTKMTLPV